MRTLLLALLVAACADAPPTDNGAISYRRDIQPIWDKWCGVECHRPGWNLNLEAGASYRALLNDNFGQCARDVVNYGEISRTPLRMLEPHDPDESALVLITGGFVTQDEHPDIRCSTVMPRLTLGLRVKSPEDWERIRRWVSEGAHDN